ncbi:hypothetical protein MUK70_18985 [Dyadobacter chenwenxiniae]|uniref:Uncharacterized protein n=1 Tax=Dyadobacter chenwenxiniae TaxID=2906456 RepID=A0A9X1PMR8_9BACT|nr:hypothetical protein [Dyadobacter chenwenxiniae]MCF0061326.1 hypothetical protein [Dyadobacter chenwenxiniae]UON81148.1 hypothetical protein MUK70_18985 [Dyadobacter chenwenxiniae]
MTQENQTEKKYPTHTIYFLTDKKDSDKKDWNKAGAAWIHADNDGMNLVLNIFGQQTPLTIRKYIPREN